MPVVGLLEHQYLFVLLNQAGAVQLWESQSLSYLTRVSFYLCLLQIPHTSYCGWFLLAPEMIASVGQTEQCYGQYLNAQRFQPLG